MIVATIGESAVDDAVYRVLVDRVVGAQTQPPKLKAFRRRSGNPLTESFLRAVLAECHYHTDVFGVVIVIDGNGSPPHQDSPSQIRCDPKCKFCNGQSAARDLLSSFKARHIPPLRIAIGVAYPSIENWLLFGRIGGCSEFEWFRERESNLGAAPNRVRTMKDSLDLGFKAEADRIRDCVAHAQRIGENLTAFEANFPIGFGLLAKELRTWCP